MDDFSSETVGQLEGLDVDKVRYLCLLSSGSSHRHRNPGQRPTHLGNSHRLRERCRGLSVRTERVARIAGRLMRGCLSPQGATRLSLVSGHARGSV